MTSLESVLHTLKYMSKRSKFIVETKIPDLARYLEKREAYEKFFQRCNGVSFLVCYLKDNIEDNKNALFLACFDSKEDVEEFFRMCNEHEKKWSDEHSAERMADSIFSNMAEGDSAEGEGN